MARRVAFSQVCFDLNNPSDNRMSANATNEMQAEQIAGNLKGWTQKEGTGKPTSQGDAGGAVRMGGIWSLLEFLDDTVDL